MPHWPIAGALLLYLYGEALGAPLMPPSTNLALTTKTIWSTNPLVTFAPESSCHRARFGACQRYMPWERKVYRSEKDYKNYIYHQTSNWENDPSGDQIRRMEIGMRGARQICLFGAPPSQLYRSLGSQQVCIDWDCTSLDIAAIYDEAEYHSPVLLWCSGTLNPYTFHQIQLRLVEPSHGRDVKDISFHHLEYIAEKQPTEPEYQLEHGQKFVKNTFHSTSAAISYHPQYYWYNNRKHDPWDKMIYKNEYGEDASYYRTSNWLNEPERDPRRAEMVFQGSAVYVYGAPPAEIRGLRQDGFGKMELILDENREPIDLEQIYLNIDPAHDRRDVLLYSSDRLDPKRNHHLRIHLTTGTSQVESVIKTMALAKIEVTEVKTDHPIVPGTKFHHEHIGIHDLSYRPALCLQEHCEGSFWSLMRYMRHWWSEETFASLTTVGMHDSQPPTADVTFYVRGETTSLRLIGPPRSTIRNLIARQSVTISGLGRFPLDVEQAYLEVHPNREDEPVVIWSADQIPRTTGLRAITLEMADALVDSSFLPVKEMGIQRIEYTWEEIPLPPPKPWEGWAVISDAIATFFRTISDAIATVPRIISDAIATVFHIFSDSIVTVFRTISDAIATFFRTISDAIATVFRIISDSIVTVFRIISDAMAAVFRIIVIFFAIVAFPTTAFFLLAAVFLLCSTIIARTQTQTPSTETQPLVNLNTTQHSYESMLSKATPTLQAPETRPPYSSPGFNNDDLPVTPPLASSAPDHDRPRPTPSTSSTHYPDSLNSPPPHPSPSNSTRRPQSSFDLPPAGAQGLNPRYDWDLNSNSHISSSNFRDPSRGLPRGGNRNTNSNRSSQPITQTPAELSIPTFAPEVPPPPPYSPAPSYRTLSAHPPSYRSPSPPPAPRHRGPRMQPRQSNSRAQDVISVAPLDRTVRQPTPAPPQPMRQVDTIPNEPIEATPALPGGSRRNRNRRSRRARRSHPVEPSNAGESRNLQG